MDARLMTFLCRKITVVKSEEVKTRLIPDNMEN
jgi:hypothetical protein